MILQVKCVNWLIGLIELLPAHYKFWFYLEFMNLEIETIRRKFLGFNFKIYLILACHFDCDLSLNFLISCKLNEDQSLYCSERNNWTQKQENIKSLVLSRNSHMLQLATQSSSTFWTHDMIFDSFFGFVVFEWEIFYYFTNLASGFKKMHRKSQRQFFES